MRGGGMILRALAEHRLLPVVTVPDVAAARGLARALLDAGLPLVEVTCRTPAALPAISALRAEFPGLLVGAGTVLDAVQARAAVAAGAQFLLSPGFDAATVAAAQALGVPLVPGVMTPSDVMAALAAGLGRLKLFPAATIGGIGYLRTLAAVFPGVRFVPTGGVDGTNLAAYLAEPNVACCGGSWLAPAAALRAGRWDEIHAGVRAALAVRGARAARAAARGGAAAPQPA